MMGIKSRIDIGLRLDAETWAKLSAKIIDRICAKRNCRIGFRQGLLLDIDGALLELIYVEDDIAKMSFVEIECLIRDYKHLVICLDAVYKASEEIYKTIKGEEIDRG